MTMPNIEPISRKRAQDLLTANFSRFVYVHRGQNRSTKHWNDSDHMFKIGGFKWEFLHTVPLRSGEKKSYGVKFHTLDDEMRTSELRLYGDADEILCWLAYAPTYARERIVIVDGGWWIGYYILEG